MRPLPKVALGTAVASIAIPVLVPVALALGLVAWRRSSDGQARALARLAVGLALIAGVGWGTLILGRRSRVSEGMAGAECSAELQSLLLAQERFRAERNRFADLGELGLKISDVHQTAAGPDAAELTKLNVGRTGTCPDCQVVLACRASGRWWTISSADRQLDGRTAIAGVPVQH